MFGVLITAYQQVEQTRTCIEKLMASPYDDIGNCPIIIVSTSKEDVGFSGLAKEFGCEYIHFADAPTDNGAWKSKSNPWIKEKHPLSQCPSWPNGVDPPGGLWRYNWLAMRILLSMQKGLEKASEIGVTELLHLHSDTYWEPDKHHNLIADINLLRRTGAMLLVDIAQQQENGVLPPDFRFCPEGMMFNIEECKRFGYGFKFDTIYSNDNSNGDFKDLAQFCCQDYCACEALLGQFAYYCLTGKNVYSAQDEVCPIFREKVKVRTRRNHHGSFDTGLVNVETSQPMRG